MIRFSSSLWGLCLWFNGLGVWPILPIRYRVSRLDLSGFLVEMRNGLRGLAKFCSRLSSISFKTSYFAGCQSHLILEISKETSF